jgi:hypothetical protein
MKGKIISQITPQNKMVAVNNKFGNTNIASQQGTTRVLFDSIQFLGQQEFRFFENAGSKQYPFTNIGAEGNRLNVGETFVIEKIYFAVFTTDADTGAIIDFFSTLGGAPFTLKGELNFQIANNQVIKQLPLDMFLDPGLNSTAVSNTDAAFDTFTDIVIPPLLEYILSVRLAYSAVPETPTYLVCFIEGSAGILAPQTTF